MAFRIDISPLAESDIEEAWNWIRGRSEVAAAKWLADFELSLQSLRQMPNRCPIASETHSFLIEIRNLLFGHESLQHRIIYGVSVDEKSDKDVVTIYRVRNSRQRPLTGREIFGDYDDE